MASTVLLAASDHILYSKRYENLQSNTFLLLANILIYEIIYYSYSHPTFLSTALKIESFDNCTGVGEVKSFTGMLPVVSCSYETWTL
jgi:hypothetical protein